MKSLFSFSRNKFLALDSSSRQKAIFKLLRELEQSIGQPERFHSLSTEVSNCLAWTDSDLPPELEAVNSALIDPVDKYQLSLVLQNYFSSKGIQDKDYCIPVLTSDGGRDPNPTALNRSRQIIVILDNLRSAFNVGSVFRTAECLALGAVWLCGITTRPGQRQLDKTAMGTTDKVTWRYYDSTLEALEVAQSGGYRIHGLETAQDATSVFATQFSFPLALVLGNESLGINPQVLAACHHLVSLPILGWKNSLNVASAFTACAYQIVFGQDLCMPEQGNSDDR